MKTTTIIIAAIFTLQAGILFAGNDNISTPVANITSAITLTALAPSTPVEATFEDMIPLNEMNSLIPVIPAEATFEEMPADMISLVMLAPVTPVTADFNDSAVSVAIAPASLAPITPATADFE
ncbi:MAG: hypothetical protein WCK09_11765 [Bacteroidota bacterium]